MTNAVKGFVQTQGEGFAFVRGGEHKRIAAHEGRDVIRFPFAVLADKQVFTGAHTHDGDRQYTVIVFGEDDGEVVRRVGKFHRSERDRMDVLGEIKTLGADDGPIGVALFIHRGDVFIKQRSVRHFILPLWQSLLDAYGETPCELSARGIEKVRGQLTARAGSVRYHCRGDLSAKSGGRKPSH